MTKPVGSPTAQRNAESKMIVMITLPPERSVKYVAFFKAKSGRQTASAMMSSVAILRAASFVL